MKKIILILTLFFSSFLHAQTTIDSDATAAYVPPNFIVDDNDEFQLSTGAFFFDATKRMGVFTVLKNTDGTYEFKYLGEEQPDAIYETVKEFMGNISANYKKEININSEVSTLVEKLVNQLTNKSNSLNFLRTSLYRLNETTFNGDLDSESYTKLYELIITTSAELQKKELAIENETMASIEKSIDSDSVD